MEFFQFLFVLLAIMAAFYFILLRPVLTQQRQQRRDISRLGIGDEVLTTGGFYATVKEINTFEDRPMEIVLEAAPGVLLRATTQGVARVSRRLSDEEPEEEEIEDEEEEWDDEDWEDEDLEDEDWDEEEDWEDDEDDWEEDENRLQVARRQSS